MFPSTSSRETLRLSGKQNSLFPSGVYIKCILFTFLVASFLDGRTGAQCMHRYLKSLDPQIKKGKWDKEEDDVIIYQSTFYLHMHANVNRWCYIILCTLCNLQYFSAAT